MRTGSISGRGRKADVDRDYKEGGVSLGEYETLEQRLDVENVRIVRSVWWNHESREASVNHLRGA